MSKTIALISPIDGKPVPITPAGGQMTQFKRGKCWSAFCQNPIWFVRIQKSGLASTGYCYGCANWRVLRNHLVGVSDRGTWSLMWRRKLEPWGFNEKTKSFEPIKPKRRITAWA